MQSLGYIAAGGTDGTLKLLKLADTQQRGPTGPATHLAINQNLDGHSGIVYIAKWNEIYQKLTTSDSNGLIIVWLTRHDSWYEEMINNRNKSIVIDMVWSHNGTKIVIAYEDGQIIVGSVSGNRLWSKDISGNIAAWSANSSLLLFGMSDGEVHVYDGTGLFIQKVHMVCLEEVELETALSKDLRRDTIVSMEWLSSAMTSKLVDERICDQTGISTSSETVPSLCENISENKPRLHIAYKHGVIQLMRNENDTNPIVVKLPNMMINKARWNPSGDLLAICGIQTDLNCDKCVVHFISAYGESQNVLQIPGETITDLSWEAGGLRICMAADSHLFFANIRPNYKWTYCGQTIVYSYEKDGKEDNYVAFFETKLEETYKKYVGHLIGIGSYDEHCVIVNSKLINLEAKYVTMNASFILVASNNAFMVTRYVIPSSSLRDKQASASSNDELVYNVDEARSSDPRIKSLCRESGIVQRYSLPQIVLLGAFSIGLHAKKIELNCNGTRLAALSSSGLKLFELTENKIVSGNFERKDIWNFKWDSDKDDSIAVLEKSRLYVVRNAETEESTINNGYIGSFRNLTIRTILLDEIMKNPETPHKSCIVDVEIKSLRDAKNLLEKMKIQEAAAYIEKKNHPKLWALLAEVALNQLNLETAEHAFVMLKDYGGIQFIKRIKAIQNDDFKRAEIAIFYGKVEEAEKIYMENDRRDLAIAAHQKLNNWFRIMEIVQRRTEPGDDELLKKAWNHVGDYYAERQNWSKASKYFENCENYEKLAQCHLMNEDYDGLEFLAKLLPDEHNLLMCGKVNDALDICVQLNQWDYAVQLSKIHHLRDIDSLLGKYAEQFAGSNERTLAVVQLYRRAGRFLDAARTIFNIANDERSKQAQPLRLKKLYVLGALLVEEYHEQSKAEITKEIKNGSKAEISLKGLLEDDKKLSMADTSLIDNAWRGAEAYHFYMLAQRQLFSALTSCMARQFAVCSRAFIKLESLINISSQEREAYSKLALNIFIKYSPVNTHVTKVECTGCNELIPDFCQVCPSCDTKFPICIVTGRPLLDFQFWLCPTCKHRAYEQEIMSFRFCPLCHADI
ncbi:unnamed protein product [Dracunculus medinensis]|uniref:ANAPC4_WD40 domain-containing protein n=1 Tax=Dracunculus medinensis TaxID=318479 RepID=A0A0N4UCK6_DRAME|nr:unnamed protein product [Dracunculus medinensis]